MAACANARKFVGLSPVFEDEEVLDAWPHLVDGMGAFPWAVLPVVAPATTQRRAATK